MATEGVLSNLGTGSPNLLAFTPRVLSSGSEGPTSIDEAGDYDGSRRRTVVTTTMTTRGRTGTSTEAGTAVGPRSAPTR
jgi:hypothetical protein